MFRINKTVTEDARSWDYDFEFWPKEAEKFLESHEYEKAADICKENLDRSPKLLSGRLIYAQALLGLKKLEEAAEQFYFALSLDTDNLVALKHLGDIHYSQGDFVSAMSSYNRSLEIDPDCSGLKSDLKRKEAASDKRLTLIRGAEVPQDAPSESMNRPFVTETMGDLYLAQGQPRVALEIFRELCQRINNPRLKEKLSNAVKKVAQKDHKDVR